MLHREDLRASRGEGGEEKNDVIEDGGKEEEVGGGESDGSEKGNLAEEN